MDIHIPAEDTPPVVDIQAEQDMLQEVDKELFLHHLV